MTATGSDDLVASRVRVMQIIVGALLLGVAVFAGIAVFNRQQQNKPGPAVPVVSYTAIGFAVVAFASRLVLMSIFAATARKSFARVGSEVDLKRWLDLYQTRMIVGAALLEAPAFCALLGYLVEGAPWALGLAGVMWLALAWLHFPTRERVAAWIAAQQDAAAQSGAGA